MVIAGVILAAGMVMDLAACDYLNGNGPVSFTIDQVVEVRGDWVILDGQQRPTPTQAWCPRRLYVRLSALKRSLVLL